MFSDFLAQAALLLAAAGFAFAAWSDFRRYIIPNRVCLFLASLFPFFIVGLLGFEGLISNLFAGHLLSGLLVLVIGFVLFAMNVIGAGDIKLLAAGAVWAGPALLAPLVVLTAVAGGFLALGYMVGGYLLMPQEQAGALSFRARLKKLKSIEIPYGIAISLASGFVLFSHFAILAA